MSNVAIVLLRDLDDFGDHDNRNRQVFLVRNKRYNSKCKDCIRKKETCSAHLLYGNPAGELEKYETFMDAAKREFLEETQCELPSLNDSMIYKEHDTILIIKYVSDMEKSKVTEKIIDNDEIYDSKWVNIDDVMNLPLMGVCKKLYPKYIPIWKRGSSQTCLRTHPAPHSGQFSNKFENESRTPLEQNKQILIDAIKK